MLDIIGITEELAFCLNNLNDICEELSKNNSVGIPFVREIDKERDSLINIKKKLVQLSEQD